MWIFPSRPTDVDVDHAPRVGPVGRWAYGVALAAMPVLLGIYCLLADRAWFLGRGGPHEVTGWAAVGLAAAYIAAGAFMHFHFFWATHSKLWRFARCGKIASLLALAAGLGLAVVFALVIPFKGPAGG